MQATRWSSRPSNRVRIRTEGYKKGLYGGSLIEVPVTHDDPPIFDYAEGRGVVAYIDLNGYLVLEEGPELD